MLPAKEVKCQVSNLKYKVVVPEIELCSYCNYVYTALKNNSTQNLKRLRLSKPSAYCYCDKANEIEIQIFKRRNCNAPFQKVGTLTLRSINKTTYETHSELNCSLHNKKIGLWMYCLGADWCRLNKLKLKSSDSYSDEAGRLWNSKTLRKYYNLTKAKKRNRYANEPRFTISPKRTTKLAKFPKSSLVNPVNRTPLVAKLLAKSK